MNCPTDTEQGYSMIEVLFSFALFGLLMGTALPASLQFAEYNRTRELYTFAAQAAQEHFDALRQENPYDLPSSGEHGPETISVGNLDFDVYTTYCEDAALCPTVNTRHIGVSVVFNDKEILHAETVYTKLK